VARVLVTGGTGTLGTPLVALLAARGHEVRSLSRHRPLPGDAADAARVTQVRANVQTGEGLGDAVAGVDAVIHAATSSRMSRAVELEGTANVMAAAAEVSAHLVYVSIVGVDKMSFAYYRAKRDAERLVETGSARWTIQRATQFHHLIDRFLGWPLFPVTRHMAFQPVDVGEVGERLADLVDAGPTGRAEDFGGPAVVPIRQLAALRRTIVGSSATLVRVPALGPLAGFDQGRHLCPDHAAGHLTWEQWLRTRPAATG
jgi:uncharacterized protein YbjT (DUF2867 family)